MIDLILSFYSEMPVIAGMVTGGVMFGVPTAIIGYHWGASRALDRVLDDLRPLPYDVIGDMPNLPQREAYRG